MEPEALAARFVPSWKIVLALAALSLLICGCQPVTKRGSWILGKNQDYAVIHASEQETLASLAKEFLGDEKRGWIIGDQNGTTKLIPGDTAVIPLRKQNLIGVRPGSYQTVPVLSYHHFGARKGRLSVTSEQFRAQLEYLKSNGFTVIPLAQLHGFLRGEEAVPQRSVVITVDDGNRSAYEVAFPILQEYGVPATLFVYTDRVGRGGLSWSQLQEMEASGLIEVQPHSKSHADLTVGLDGESIEEYKRRISTEVRWPKEQLSKKLGNSIYSYSYPYGAANNLVVDELRGDGYELGFTVKRGGNGFFYYPFALRRTMIYRSDSLDQFARALQTSVATPRRQ